MIELHPGQKDLISKLEQYFKREIIETKKTDNERFMKTLDKLHKLLDSCTPANEPRPKGF